MKYLSLISAAVSCPELSDPTDGNVTLSGLTFGSSATYSCIAGFRLAGGDELRMCMADMEWSGDAPICTSMLLGHFADTVCGGVHNYNTSINLKNYSGGLFDAPN